MTTKEINMNLLKWKIENEADFIVNPRFENSLKKIMTRYSHGCPEHIIKKSLILNINEMNFLHKKAIKTLAESITN
jgi:hypothetical protein